MSKGTFAADCMAVRDRLAEYALSALPEDLAAFVERHLEWCAGCRREVAELTEAAASVAMSLPQARPSGGLEDRVVKAVRTAAAGGTSAPHKHRTMRALKVATVVAVLFAVTGVGFGASVLGKLQRAQDAERAAKAAAHELTVRLHVVLQQFLNQQPVARLPKGPRERLREVDLLGAPGVQGGGGADVFTSPTREDWLLVALGGLSPKGLPYRVTLIDERFGAELQVGKVARLGRGGQGQPLWHEYATDLRQFSRIEVTDRSGRVVLSGEIPAVGKVTATPSG